MPTKRLSLVVIKKLKNSDAINKDTRRAPASVGLLLMFLLLIVLPTLICIFPKETYALPTDLIQAYDLMMANSAKWSARQAQIAARQTAPASARAQLLPQVGADIQWTRVDYSGQTVDFDLDLNRLEDCAGSIGSVDSINIGAAFDRLECLFLREVEPFASTRFALSFTQPLFRSDRWHQYRRAKALYNQGNAELEKNRQDLLLELATSYFNTLKAKEALLVLQNEQEALAYSLKLTEKRYEKGLAKSAQVYEAKARFDAGLTQLLRAENAVQQALGQLAALTQSPAIDTTELPGAIELFPPKPDHPQAWIDLASRHSPELKMAALNQDMAQANVAAKKAAHLPTLDFVASISGTDAGGATPAFDAGTNTNTTLGLSFQLPLFTGGAITTAKKQATFQYQAARWEAAQARQQLVQQLLSQFQTVTLTVKQGKAQARATLSSEKAYQAIEAGYKAGSHTLNELLQAQRSVYLAQRDRAETHYAYVLAVLNLKRMAGVLMREDLEVLNQWLPPVNRTP